jgi:hypothetical protein
MMEWFESAQQQITAALISQGHTPVLEQRAKSIVVTNPLFSKQRTVVIFWYYRPRQVFKRDKKTGIIVYKKQTPKEIRTGAAPVPALQNYWPDMDNLVKGTLDALEKAGVIDNDKFVFMAPPCIDMDILEPDAEPFMGVEVRYRQNDASDYIIAPGYPGLPMDTAVYMPRVFDGGHKWHVIKKEEENYQKHLQSTGAATQVVSKCRCRRCKLWIGAGHAAQEIWVHWDEARWGKETILICEWCAKEIYERSAAIQQQITQRALTALAPHGVLSVPPDGHAMRGLFEVVSRKVAEVLYTQYAENRRIVTSSEIGTIPWIGPESIEARRETYNHRLFGDLHDAQQPPRDSRSVKDVRDRKNRRPTDSGISDRWRQEAVIEDQQQSVFFEFNRSPRRVQSPHSPQPIRDREHSSPSGD